MFRDIFLTPALPDFDIRHIARVVGGGFPLHNRKSLSLLIYITLLMMCAVSSFEAQAESYKRVKNSVNFSNNYQGTICMRQLFGREA